MDIKTKNSIRKRAKSILHTYIHDGNYINKTPMDFYFRAVKYIMTYGK